MNVEAMYTKLYDALMQARMACDEIKAATGVDVEAYLDLDPNPDAIQPIGMSDSDYVTVDGVEVAIEADTGFFRFKSIDERAADLKKYGKSMLPNRFMIDPDRLRGKLSEKAANQALLNTNFARFFLGMLGGLKPGDFTAAAQYTPSMIHEGQQYRGQPIPNAVAFAGDLIIKGKLVWKGPTLAEAEAAVNRAYDTV